MDTSAFPTIYGKPLTVERFIEFIIKRDTWLFDIINRINKYFEFVDLEKDKAHYARYRAELNNSYINEKNVKNRKMIECRIEEFSIKLQSIKERLEEVKKEQDRLIVGTFAEVNEFMYKISSGHSTMNLLKRWFITDSKYNFCHTLYKSFLSRVHSFLTTTPEGERFQKYMMEELSPEEFKEVMDILDIPCSSATVEQREVSMRMDKNKVVSFM